MEYDMPLYRPPSEARSLIFQVTLGCSWNKCMFCAMYKTKDFLVRPFEEIEKEVMEMARHYPRRARSSWLTAILWLRQRISLSGCSTS